MHELQARVLLELALGPAGEAAIRPEGDTAVPRRCVARVRGEQADGDLVLTRGLMNRQAEMVRVC